MTKKNDGGPAFPGKLTREPGMSLRDWFAGQALGGFIARSITEEDWRRLPYVAYEMADAMLEARQNSND